MYKLHQINFSSSSLTYKTKNWVLDCLLLFPARVSLYSPDYSGMLYVDRAGLEFTDPPPPLPLLPECMD